MVARVEVGVAQLHQLRGAQHDVGEVVRRVAAEVQDLAGEGDQPAAVKLGLGLLLAPASQAKLRRFADEVLASGAPYLTMSMVPRYWFYPRIFGDTPGQGAYQSVWLTPRAVPDCPVCGPAEARIDPLEVPLGTPPREAFDELMGAAYSNRASSRTKST